MTAPPLPGSGAWAPWSLHATAVSSRAKGSGHRRARLMASPGCRGLLRYRKRRPFARLGGSMSLCWNAGGLRHEQVGAVARLCRARGDRPAAGNALGGRQPGPVLYGVDQLIERALRVRLDELELREGVRRRRRSLRRRLVRLDVVAVLDLVEAVRGLAIALVVIAALGLLRGHLARIGAGVMVDGQERIHRSRDGDQRAPDLPGGLERLDLPADVAQRAARPVVVRAGAGAVGVVGRVEPFLPLALGHFPEAVRVVGPHRAGGARDDVRRIRP